MPASIGQRIKRKEDPRLITGNGVYVDDIQLPGMTHAVIVRSPHAHARIVHIDAERALAAPGVVAVVTGEEMKKAMVAPIPCFWAPPFVQNPPHWPLAVDTARYVGDGVAVVVADAAAAARDAADLIQVEYEPLPAAADLESAARPDAPKVHAELANNITYEFKFATDNIDQAFAGADVVVKTRNVQQRLVPNAMEPRAALAEFRKYSGEVTLWSTTQNPHLLKTFVAACLNIPEQNLRVIAPDVGGGFGSKISMYPEDYIVTYLAMKLGRPVKWTATRQESFLATTHGRRGVAEVEMAARRDGTILGCRINWLADMGAYNMAITTFTPLLGFGVSPGPYRWQEHAIDVTAVFTNTMSTDAYRGAGRPEATYYLERTIDALARELNMDPAAVRRKNFVRKDEFPYTNPTGFVMDSGDYETALSRALEAAGYQELRQDQARRRQQGGKLLGIGISSYIEACGVGPSKALAAVAFGGNLFDAATVRVEHTGKVTVYTGASAHGQGHETTFAQIVADQLGVAVADVAVLHGDTGRGPVGLGTYGSRSLAVAGAAMYQALQQIKDKARRIAAHRLECHPDDVEIDEGRIAVKGSPDRSIAFAEIAAAANFGSHMNYPEDLDPGLEATVYWQPENFTWPFGTHICVVEVDPEDGKVQIQRYVAVDDAGTIINPLIADGQVHGGIAQGIAQALFEELVYDPSGQPLGTSLMDYAVPTAPELPAFENHYTHTPTPVNPLGAKGIGEAGTIGAAPAVVNAVVDALSHLGVREIDMPLTPERVWKAIQQATKGGVPA